jgi:glycosyltransferase involved in cell wall biosynthesis
MPELAAEVAPPPPSAGASERPLVTMMLIAYNQETSIGEAIAGALAQTYSPLEIFVSDDASSDGTHAAMLAAVAGYDGPHRVVVHRNETNLGIGAHLSLLVERSRGELLFVAAGDDVSLPERCEKTVDAWLASGKTLDLIAAPLIDIDSAGHAHGVLRPSDLSTYRGASDWLARRPYVVGAAQAWTRRLIERFGPIPAGTMGEDMLMVFRAICSGGAITLDEPLVRYRRGGISRRRRSLDAASVVARIRKNNRNALVELQQLLADAERAGVAAVVAPALEARLARERFIRDEFDAPSLPARLRIAAGARSVPIATRARMLVYAAFPQLLAPFFAVKRGFARGD